MNMNDNTNDSNTRSCDELLRQSFSLIDRTVVLTGASRGIGRQLLRTLLTAGADVACLDILPGPTSDELDELKQRCGARESRVSFFKCDIVEELAVKETLAQVQEIADLRRRPIKGLVNCAGVQMAGDACELPAENFRTVIDVNVTGSFLIAREVAKIMRSNDMGGSLLLVASMAGHAANRGIYNSNYNSSKSAVIQLCRSLALEWGRHGIRVNSLSPGYTRTQMIQDLLDEEPELEQSWLAGSMLGRLGEVQDLDAAVLFVLGNGSSFMTGADVRVDGGNCAAV